MPLKAFFEFLSAPGVKEWKSSGVTVRRGEGVTCFKYKDTFNYCYQTFNKKGVSSNGLNYVESTEDLPYADFYFEGAKAKKLYDFLEGSGDTTTLSDGSLERTRIGRRISCSEFVKDDLSTYSCTQTLTSDGVAWGNGTDPIVNVGTRGLVLEFMDPASTGPDSDR